MITEEVLEMPVENEASDRKWPLFGKRADLLARVEEKRAAVLAWLGAEIFSSAAILGQVMGLKKRRGVREHGVRGLPQEAPLLHFDGRAEEEGVRERTGE